MILMSHKALDYNIDVYKQIKNVISDDVRQNSVNSKNCILLFSFVSIIFSMNKTKHKMHNSGLPVRYFTKFE